MVRSFVHHTSACNEVSYSVCPEISVFTKMRFRRALLGLSMKKLFRIGVIRPAPMPPNPRDCCVVPHWPGLRHLPFSVGGANRVCHCGGHPEPQALPPQPFRHRKRKGISTYCTWYASLSTRGRFVSCGRREVGILLVSSCELLYCCPQGWGPVGTFVCYLGFRSF